MVAVLHRRGATARATFLNRRDRMSKLVMCGIDLARGSERTAAVAARVARALGCRAAVVHVDDEPPGVASIHRARELGALETLVDDHGFPGGTLVRLAGGEPATSLVRVARDHDAQLLVVGSRGLGELRTALLGSVSTELFRRAPCPVVVVPPRLTLPFAHPGLGPIVCGVDGSERDRGVLRLADDLADRLGTEVVAVHAFDARAVYAAHPMAISVSGLREAGDERLERAVADAGVSAQRALASLPPADALAQAAEECRAGLVVVGSHGGGRLGALLRGSVVTQLRSRIDRPLVVLPPGAELAAGSGHYELTASAA
jgi:nucleotide-binding universal stress UspA family protein